METKNQNGDQLIEIEQINKTTVKTKKKLSRGMHVFSVVMFMLRRRRRRKSFNTGFWRRVVDSVRKVHSEITIMPSSTIVLPPPPPPPPPTKEFGLKADPIQGISHIISDLGFKGHPKFLDRACLESGDDDDNDNDNDDDYVPETIKEVFTVASSSSSSGISGYGSALSLRDLGFRHDNDDDDDDDTDDDDCYSDVDGGDDMIDQKAEEFIVKFYEQMKMQNEVYNAQRYKAKGIMMN